MTSSSPKEAIKFPTLTLFRPYKRSMFATKRSSFWPNTRSSSQIGWLKKSTSSIQWRPSTRRKQLPDLTILNLFSLFISPHSHFLHFSSNKEDSVNSRPQELQKKCNEEVNSGGAGGLIEGRNECFLGVNELRFMRELTETVGVLIAYGKKANKILFYLNQIDISTMLRRQLQPTQAHQRREERTYQKSNSNSTQDGKEDSVDAKYNKLKSQLCKKYMENGYCPYEKRCKFAHGLGELRKNNQYNSKYKTKECGSFKNNHFCIYGDRCNFIHVTTSALQEEETLLRQPKTVDVDMELIRSINQKQSKLLSLLF